MGDLGLFYTAMFFLEILCATLSLRLFPPRIAAVVPVEYRHYEGIYIEQSGLGNTQLFPVPSLPFLHIAQQRREPSQSIHRGEYR